MFNQWANMSVYYLMGLWSRLVTSKSYTKADALDEYLPKITKGFIGRFNFVQATDDVFDNPLDNIELLQDQFDCFSNIYRFELECGSYIENQLKPILKSYVERESVQSTVNEVSVIEAKIAWLVHIIAATLPVKQTPGARGRSIQVTDAKLSAEVVNLIKVTDSGLHNQRYDKLSKQRLDRAILTFFQNLRKSYLGVEAVHSSEFFNAKLCDILGYDDK